MSNQAVDRCYEILAEDDGQIVAACRRTVGHDGWHASGPLAWEQDPCPYCGAPEPKVEGGSTPGFTGAAIYYATFLCCGAQDVDASGDNLEAAR